MLRIRETEPYYILPTQRYDLTTRPPSQSMQGDYTLFVSWNAETLLNNEKPCSIIMRPGMHYGLCYSEKSNSINFEYWTKVDGENKFHFATISLFDDFPKYHLTNIWFCIIRHDSESKSIQLDVYSEGNELKSFSSEYEGELVNYSGTPYNFGCGNYFKQVDDTHYFFGDYTLHNVGLVENIEHTNDEIKQFIFSNKKSFDKLQDENQLSDLVFYFNMKNQSIYKIWDLSGHCNFLMKNMDVFK